MAAVPRVLLLPIGTPETTCFVRVAKDDNTVILYQVLLLLG